MKLLLVPIACSVAETVTHPIDIIKTRLQLQSGQSIFEIIRQIYNIHGIKGFYRSLQPAIARHWIYSTGRVTLYEQLKTEEEGLVIKIRNGFIAGGLSQWIASPMDLIKIRMQGGQTTSMIEIIKTIVQKEGYVGLYRGWQPNVARAGLVNIGELVAYDYGKKFLLKREFKDNIGTHFMCSVFSGLCSTIVSTPADVVKSNFMNQPERYHHSVMNCIAKIYQEKGLFYFWRGSFLNWVRLGPWQMIFWMTYENLALWTRQKTF